MTGGEAGDIIFQSFTDGICFRVNLSPLNISFNAFGDLFTTTNIILHSRQKTVGRDLCAETLQSYFAFSSYLNVF